MNFFSASFSVAGGSGVESVTLELCCMVLNCCKTASMARRAVRNKSFAELWAWSAFANTALPTSGLLAHFDSCVQIDCLGVS